MLLQYPEGKVALGGDHALKGIACGIAPFFDVSVDIGVIGHDLADIADTGFFDGGGQFHKRHHVTESPEVKLDGCHGLNNGRLLPPRPPPDNIKLQVRR